MCHKARTKIIKNKCFNLVKNISTTYELLGRWDQGRSQDFTREIRNQTFFPTDCDKLFLLVRNFFFHFPRNKHFSKNKQKQNHSLPSPQVSTGWPLSDQCKMGIPIFDIFGLIQNNFLYFIFDVKLLLYKQFWRAALER